MGQIWQTRVIMQTTSSWKSSWSKGSNSRCEVAEIRLPYILPKNYKIGDGNNVNASMIKIEKHTNSNAFFTHKNHFFSIIHWSITLSFDGCISSFVKGLNFIIHGLKIDGKEISEWIWDGEINDSASNKILKIQK